MLSIAAVLRALPCRIAAAVAKYFCLTSKTKQKIIQNTTFHPDVSSLEHFSGFNGLFLTSVVMSHRQTAAPATNRVVRLLHLSHPFFFPSKLLFIPGFVLGFFHFPLTAWIYLCGCTAMMQQQSDDDTQIKVGGALTVTQTHTHTQIDHLPVHFLLLLPLLPFTY